VYSTTVAIYVCKYMANIAYVWVRGRFRVSLLSYYPVIVITILGTLDGD